MAASGPDNDQDSDYWEDGGSEYADDPSDYTDDE